MAAPETREYMEDLKITIHDEIDKYTADVLVPNCVYRCGCPEQQTCGFFQRLADETDSLVGSVNIQERYDAYNEWFYREKKHE